MSPQAKAEGTTSRLTKLVAAAFLFGAATPAWAHHVEKHFPVVANPIIMVHNSSGTITIRSWQKPEVQVIADHASKKVEVDVAQKGNLVDIHTHILSEDVRPGELQANYQITVPEQSQLQIRNDAGSVLVEQVAGDMTLETVAANVELQQATGYLSARTVGGSFTCVECIGRIEANSISGNIRLIRAQSQDVRVQTSSGDILLDSDLRPNGTYRLKNYTGRIEVRFSPTDSFDLSATSVYGKVENEANLKPSPHVSQHVAPGLSKSLFGTYNEGKARVEVTSFSGTIQIRKRE